jgi:CHAT domain-containing protein
MPATMPATRWMMISALTVLLVSPLAGCSTVGVREQSLIADSNYEQLIRDSKEKNRFETADIGSLDAMCKAYFETRDYNGFMKCSEVLIRRAPREGARHTTANRRKLGAWWGGGMAGGLVDRYMTQFFTYEDIVAPMLSKRAMINVDFEDYADAISNSNQAVDYLTRSHTKYPDFLIEAYGVSGLAYALSGDSENASDRVKNLVEMKIDNEDSDILRRTALIRIFIALKKYENARHIMSFGTSSSFVKFIDKIDIGWKLAGREATNIEIPNQFMVAKILYETGDLDAARQQYDVLLANPGFQNLGSAYILALSDRGTIAEKAGSRRDAVTYLEKAIEIIERQRATINTEASKIGFVGDKQAVYHRLIKLLFDDGQYAKAFDYVERSKSRALVDLLAAKNNFAASADKEETIRNALAAEDTTAGPTMAAVPAAGESQTRSIKIEALKNLKASAPELASLVTVSSSSIAELTAVIPPGEALVEYYYQGTDLYAFALSKGRLSAVRLDGGGLLDSVREYRRQIQTNRSAPPSQTAIGLYTKLFKPIEPYLKTSRLIVVPHGALHYLPWAALYDGTGYLVDRYAIRVMPSASAIQYLKPASAEKPGGILAFGNPDLGRPGTDLVFAQNEAVEVARTRAHSRVLLRKDASESAFMKNAQHYAYIHFATHGIFNPEHPLKSALLLAPGGPYDGMLTADELYSMRLNARLITLSACETGISQIANGDDLVGLTRGFLYAGASAIVASLWEVDDASTAYLMTHFYRAMEQQDMAQALRTAQLETMKKFPAPYYWAAFQLTGRAR